MARPDITFDYATAFSRNIGWLTQWEQQRLRQAKVAVAGAGGVGGIHLQTLARLGFGQFHVADLDAYELANFNRQAGATLETLGAEKAKVAADLVTQINPESQVTVFPNGVTLDNLDAFLDGVDVYIDGLDFFVLDIRAALFRRARALGIVCITAAPIGMGTGYLIFTPDSMSFDDFFDIASRGDPLDDAAGFLVGLTPSMIHRGYLADQSRVDLRGQRGPSTAIACQLCAGVAAGEAVKSVLKRGTQKPAPYYHHFDSYRCKYVSRKLVGGARNPLQRFKRAMVKALTGKLSAAAVPKERDLEPSDSVLDRVIEAGRWAPSADNTQPWRFHIRSDTAFDITVALEPGNIYEYRGGEPTLLAAGMLLETMRLRAAHFGHVLKWTVEEESPHQLRVACQLSPSAAATPEPDLDYMIELRRVERAGMTPRALTAHHKAQLEASLGPELAVQWHESLAERWAHSWMNAKAAVLRFKTPETIPVHQKVVQFGQAFPRFGLPSKALGLSPIAHGVMRLALASQTRAQWLIGRLGGAYYAALEMDIIPGMFSSAHFTISAKSDRAGMSALDVMMIGQRLQRFWLMSAQLQLGFQPGCAPLCFYAYGQSGEVFSQSKRRLKAARTLSAAVDRLYGGRANHVMFRGRLGHDRKAAGRSRSLRQPASALIERDARQSLGESLISDSSTQKLSFG